MTPEKFREFDSPKELDEDYDLVLSRMSFLKKYGKDLLFSDYMNSMSMVMNEMKELEQRRQEEESKRRRKQYKQSIKPLEENKNDS